MLTRSKRSAERNKVPNPSLYDLFLPQIHGSHRRIINRMNPQVELKSNDLN